MDWNIPSLERENIIADLIGMDLLNEQRYACAFAHDKSKFNRWGKVKIRVHLKAKGISDRNITEALMTIEDEDVETSIVQLIHKKLPSLKGLQPWQKKYKLMQYLLGKGYQREDAEKCLRKLLGDSGSES
ncbi:MAG: RecX family transcriptional regulator [Flavobacteriales bacterium]|nr:RecX family transcriptional regulator [Flavobacteriales bacterium]